MKQKDENKIWAVRLRAALQRRKMSQRELARELGCIQQSISSYALGQSDPSLARLVEIARILDTTPNYLLGVTDDPRPEGCRSIVEVISATMKAENDHLARLIAKRNEDVIAELSCFQGEAEADIQAILTGEDACHFCKHYDNEHPGCGLLNGSPWCKANAVWRSAQEKQEAADEVGRE